MGRIELGDDDRGRPPAFLWLLAGNVDLGSLAFE